ncbi:MAG TPA: zf-TFIIB domain-containing protein [Polyangia bacterium]|nr:zf-TFIIB domain-containing protein [Polyangia bacterium]
MADATNICCVKCNSILDRATFQGLEVDLCPKCGGLWLDRGEITRAARLPEKELARLRSLLTGPAGPPPIPTESVAPCPACPGNLSEVMLGTVHVDYCDRCQGIFLDRGELEVAVEAVRARDRDTRPQEIVIAISTVSD